jgi:hypothetical protein
LEVGTFSYSYEFIFQNQKELILCFFPFLFIFQLNSKLILTLFAYEMVFTKYPNLDALKVLLSKGNISSRLKSRTVVLGLVPFFVFFFFISLLLGCAIFFGIVRFTIF